MLQAQVAAPLAWRPAAAFPAAQPSLVFLLSPFRSHPGRVSFRWVCRFFRIFPAVGLCLPSLECLRYCLPNFPRSPAGYGRERQQLDALLADGAQAVLLIRLIQLVDF